MSYLTFINDCRVSVLGPGVGVSLVVFGCLWFVFQTEDSKKWPGLVEKRQISFIVFDVFGLRSIFVFLHAHVRGRARMHDTHITHIN